MIENTLRTPEEQKQYATAASFLISEKIAEIERAKERIAEILAPIGGALNDITVQAFDDLTDRLQEQVIDVNVTFGV